MAQSKILLGSGSFMRRLEDVASTAKESLLAQAMTFEGDDAGKWLIKVMKASPAKDKRLLIDSYSKVVINDHFVLSKKYLADKEFRKEIKSTRKLIDEAGEAGIEVKFTNPVGFLGQKYPLRNHKKMVVVDGKHSFLGGINFSDHNFAWHDMMVELSDAKLGSSLTQDFAKTWDGTNQSTAIKTDDGQLYLLNGSKSKSLYDDFFGHIKSAKNSVQIISPYISEPLLGVLRSVADNGVKITIVSPQENNKSIFKNIILSEQQKGYFELKEYPGMSHMKAILIDDEKLIFGSSNYDLVSYYFEQEVVFVSQDNDLIQDFKKKVLSEVREPAVNDQFSKLATWKAVTLMNLLDKIGSVVSKTLLRPH
ncbi:phosphatidylserine/phosphatidylglycerophosphate/cardiolipin synthase family protein [Ekhidna sp.]|uniref:phospholipase D-like domain-containing protein n=1 Tax=Ekhidna sp. TaxID=2608089 RepID=UPI003513DFF8